jgi:hypothetical protein
MNDEEIYGLYHNPLFRRAASEDIAPRFEEPHRLDFEVMDIK